MTDQVSPLTVTRVAASADDILLVADDSRELVTVPEWGGISVWVRGLSAYDRDKWELDRIEMKRGKGGRMQPGELRQNARASLLVLALVDAENKPLFHPRDTERLGRKGAKAINRLYEVAARLSGISDEDEAELLGNSESATDDDSRSGSRLRSVG